MAAWITDWLKRPNAPEDDFEAETQSEGLKELYSGGLEPVVDICFVHGLTGNRIETWKAANREDPWPQDLLPKEIPNARILTFGYDAYIVKAGFATASRNRLIDHATKLLVALQGLRWRTETVSRPLVFVAHSMGGLLCKHAILDSRDNPAERYKDIFYSVRGVIFLGTPHRGSWMAAWAAIPVGAISSFKSTNTNVLSLLNVGNEVLEKLQRDFISMLLELRNRGRDISVYCFFEEQDTFLAGRLIVPKDSAIIEGYPNVSINADHANMAKFASANESGFLAITDELRRLVIESNDWVQRLSAADKACVRALGAVNPADYLKRIEQNNEPFCSEISDWFLKSQDFLSFIECTNTQKTSSAPCRLLWIHGPPSSGKTMLLVGAVRQLQAQLGDSKSSPTLSYLFCDKSKSGMNNPTSVLRSILWMLLSQQPRLIHYLKRKYDDSGAHLFADGLDFYALTDTFTSMIRDSSFKESYLVLDALQQFPTQVRSQFCHLIRESLSLSKRVRWLVASNSVQEIQDAFEARHNDEIVRTVVTIPNEHTENSVRTYIEYRLSQLGDKYGYNAEILHGLSEGLQNGNRNFFAGLSTAFQRLNESDSPSDIGTLDRILQGYKNFEAQPILSSSQAAFERVKKSFQASLNDANLIRKTLAIFSIEPIWLVVDDLQRSQKLQGLIRITQFLDRLKSYDVAVRQHVGAATDILALLWGPASVLLKQCGLSVEHLGTLIKTFEKIGEAVPSFEDLVHVSDNGEITLELLLLFYQDILEFYLVSLKTFTAPSFRLFPEPLLAHYERKVAMILRLAEQHSTLITSNVKLAQIQEQRMNRTQIINDFDQESNSIVRREFRALQSRISPDNDCEILDRAQSNLCAGTEIWLMGEPVYSQWKDMNNRSTNIIWLNGNPGSGKTFMAAAVAADIKAAETRLNSICLYVFLSFEQGENTTARSVYQSLIFQAASANAGLQSMLVELDERALASSTAANAKFLEDLVQGFGPFYIIVDGLDEIERRQRETILQHLVNLPKRSQNVKLLISARPEDDIKTILASKAEEIVVHEKNEASIRFYVNTRTPDIVARFCEDPETKAEIEGLLGDVVQKSEGMFLYARLVLDNLLLISDVEEIRGYLQVLPSKMDEVYHRVIQRIEDMEEGHRRKAREIISWIGCTPVPMTTLEIEHALHIHYDKTTPRVAGNTPFVRLCGPVVEIVNGCLRLVHFTFKEYIFSSNVAHSIDMMAANWSLARICLRFLCSDVFNLGIEDYKILQNIQQGKYRLQAYALMAWSRLSGQLASQQKALDECHEIGPWLEDFFQNRVNSNFDSSLDDTGPFSTMLHSRWPAADYLLRTTLRFQQDDRRIDWNFENNSEWANRDPLTLSEISCSIHRCYEACLYPRSGSQEYQEQSREGLMIHYGSSIFKCTYPSCPMNRHGFSTEEERQEHVKNHARPWKCSRSNCEFAVIGFNSTQALRQHLSKCFERNNSVSAPVASMEEEELQALLFEAVHQEKIGQLRQLLSHAIVERYRCAETTDETRSLWRRIVRDLEAFAAQKGSLTMLEMVRSGFGTAQEPLDNGEIAVESVKSGHQEIFDWALARASYRDGETLLLHRWYSALARQVLAEEHEGIYARWEDYLFIPEFERNVRRMPRSTCFEGLLPDYEKTGIVFSAPAFNAVQGDHALETRLIRTWSRFADRGDLNPGILGYALRFLARSSLSLTLGRELVRLGASVNFPHETTLVLVNGETRQRPRASGKSVLQHAVLGSTAEAAQFVQFLLQHGADPFTGKRGVVVPERGREMIESHLGLSWEDLLKRYDWDLSSRTRVEHGTGCHHL